METTPSLLRMYSQLMPKGVTGKKALSTLSMKEIPLGEVKCDIERAKKVKRHIETGAYPQKKVP
jgi:hypothetical protein